MTHLWVDGHEKVRHRSTAKTLDTAYKLSLDHGYPANGTV